MTKHTKRLSLLFCAIAFGLAAFGAPAAGAAVSFGVDASHSPVTVNRGDEYFTYSVAVKNSGTTATTAVTNLNLALPPGTLLDGIVSGTSAGWSCYLTADTCSYSNSPEIEPGTDFPVLTVGVLVDPAVAPSTLAATFTAFGGGATSGGIGQHSFTLGPQLTFGLVAGSFAAGACYAAPALTPPTSAACQSASTGDPDIQAGGHPFAINTTFEFTTKQVKPKGTDVEDPVENVGAATVNLPPGLVANPTAIVGGCKVSEVQNATCPARFAVGRSGVSLDGTGIGNNAVIYKIQPEDGYPAAFATRPVSVSGVTVVLRAKVRPGDFTVTAFVPSAPQNPALLGVKYFTFCSYGAKVDASIAFPSTFGCYAPTDPGALSIPFITNPTRCNGEEDITSMDVASYQHPGAKDGEGFPDLNDKNWKTYEASSPALIGCDQLEFDPSFEGRPTTNVADAPSGLDFDLHIPQEGLLDPNVLATPHLKRAEVVLPEGVAVNPSAAGGLEACTPDEMGFLELNHSGPFPIRFDGQPVGCPNGSKIGTVSITSPLVDQTLQGGVYLAQQDDPATTRPGTENPFDSLLAIYIAVRNDEIGVRAKLAGKVTADPVTGQLTASFEQNPQLPFDELKLKIREGARAPLRTPSICGLKTTSAEFTPWSAPESGPPATRSDSFEITTPPGDGVCPTSAEGLPNAPRLSAGTVTPKAGAYSPFVLRLARDDGSQELKGINATLPPGLTGRLAGVPYCSESAITAAMARSKPGEGAVERANPSCPSASEVGSVDAAAGAGLVPFHATGHAYLAGPYKGAPVSMVVITPAVAGPFDLGTVVIRNALYLDPVRAQVTVKSDPIPTILEGIPLDVRLIEVSVTRHQFTLNPTNCEPMSITGSAFALSSVASLTQRFQVGECKELAFKPGLKLQLHGRTKRGAYQRLSATVTYPKGPGYANISKASVALPHSEFLAQEHINTVCTRVQFAARSCPKGSVYGHATAITPLLDEPLSGPVYLRSSSNPLPDLVVALKGPDSQPVEVELAGRTDSVHGGIRNTFDLVPDAPVTKFTLELLGGKKSLIVNSRNLCKGTQRATVRFGAQNGKAHSFRPVVRNDCGRKGKKAKHHKRAALAHLLKAW